MDLGRQFTEVLSIVLALSRCSINTSNCSGGKRYIHQDKSYNSGLEFANALNATHRRVGCRTAAVQQMAAAADTSHSGPGAWPRGGRMLKDAEAQILILWITAESLFFLKSVSENRAPYLIAASLALSFKKQSLNPLRQGDKPPGPARQT